MGNCIELRSYLNESVTHSHDFAQLLLPISGSMEMEAGGYAGVINNEVGIYIAPHEKHCFAGRDKNLLLVIDLISSMGILEDEEHSRTFSISKCTQKFLSFTQQYLQEKKGNLFTDTLINQLLLHFSLDETPLERDPLVIKAKQWIDFHFKTPINVGNVANYCHLSISQLQRRFAKITGFSVAEYWRFKKLEHAKHLLLVKNSSVESVALEVGYENLPAFSRRFNKLFGESPTAWRIKALNGK
ncbi:AraC family transcriptional regulator [Legionella adelaidensis]|uniref:AraC family transcriptional regulator n=1 Tax=Legionella adelaidensis TaxID=45056 RepID=A0A0W0R184_9GAMM|nr:AraC family transcriptional regulator [Legionella adelaidensis]KTC64713.1 AraC family transcriptional regulator [Legionella adelaidensis]